MAGSGAKSFEDWLAATSLTAARENSGLLESLGVSRQTFLRPEAEVVADLVAGGLPRLAAADICHTAKKFFEDQQARAELPLGVFWDVENVRIPKEMTGDGIARAIKTRLKPFGRLSLFNAYFEVSGVTMPAEKRSGLQLSGCHIIDTPHINRKEVADKMIIVDALLFAMQHQATGGTLCFITGDTDYAYMLARLSELKQFRTVLITHRSTRDVLNLSASSVLSWGSDIVAPNPGVLLGIQSTPSMHSEKAPVSNRTPPSSSPMDGNQPLTRTGSGSNFVDPAVLSAGHKSSSPSPTPNQPPPPTSKFGDTTSPPADRHARNPRGGNARSPNTTPGPEGKYEQPKILGLPTNAPNGSNGGNGNNSGRSSFSNNNSNRGVVEGLVPTQEEELEDTKKLIQYVMFELAATGLTKPRKNLVEMKLKEKNPIRFQSPESRLIAIHAATDPRGGFLSEEKDGKGTVLTLKTDAFLPPELQ